MGDSSKTPDSQKNNGSKETPEEIKGVLGTQWKHVALLAMDVLFGVFFFTLIAGVAVGIDYLLVDLLDKIHTSKYIQYGLIGAKYFIFSSDLFLLIMYVSNTTWNFYKGMEWRK